MNPTFLTVEEVMELHRASIERYGGSFEIRDIGLLQSALGMPAASFGGEFLHFGLAAMAAALLFHLVQNHPFVDGNKRIGALASRVFVMMNDATFDPPEKDFEEVTLGVARGEVDKTAVIEFFRRHVKS